MSTDKIKEAPQTKNFFWPIIIGYTWGIVGLVVCLIPFLFRDEWNFVPTNNFLYMVIGSVSLISAPICLIAALTAFHTANSKSAPQRNYRFLPPVGIIICVALAIILLYCLGHFLLLAFYKVLFIIGHPLG